MSLMDIVRDVSVGFGLGFVAGISGLGSIGTNKSEEIENRIRDYEQRKKTKNSIPRELKRRTEETLRSAKYRSQDLRAYDKLSAYGFPPTIALVIYTPGLRLAGYSISESIIGGGIFLVSANVGAHLGKKTSKISRYWKKT